MCLNYERKMLSKIGDVSIKFELLYKTSFQPLKLCDSFVTHFIRIKYITFIFNVNLCKNRLIKTACVCGLFESNI